MTDLIGDAVRSELARFGPAAGMADLVAVWTEAVGEAIAGNAWPARIGRDGTLYVNAASSAWAFELGQLEPTIRERLRAALGNATPPKLRFAVGNLPEPDVSGVVAEPRARPAEPGPQERAAAAELTAGIADDELRVLVARAAAASLAKGSSDRSF